MTSDITITDGQFTIPAYYAHPDSQGPFSAIILIHEVWGLTEHIKDVANRFVAEGYAVLAPDLVSQTGVTEKIDQNILKEVKDPATRDEAQKKMREALAPVHSPEFAKETVQRLQACFGHLENEKNLNRKIGVVGFGFGGTYAWQLAVHEQYLAACVAFYGRAPESEEDLKSIACPVLAFYGEKDTALVSQLPQLEETLDRLEKNFDIVIYPNCGHAFFNDTNPVTYNREAAEDAWAKTIGFLSKNLSE
jgi:carboxymethylenebutenolidase